MLLMLSFSGSRKSSSRCEEGRDVLASIFLSRVGQGPVLVRSCVGQSAAGTEMLVHSNFPLADSGAVIDQWTKPASLLAN